MGKMRIAVPIISGTMDDAKRCMDRATALGVDIIELRLDYMHYANEKINVERLLKYCELPKIVTVRHKDEAGRFIGTEKKRVNYLLEAIALGAEYVDIELNHYHELPREKTQIIVSYHNFENTPSRLVELIYRKILGRNPDIAKIATIANSIDDSVRMLGLVAQAKHEGRNIIGICMGEEGTMTRVHGPAFGGYLTFASLDGNSSAPGQLSVGQIRQRWKELRYNQD